MCPWRQTGLYLCVQAKLISHRVSHVIFPFLHLSYHHYGDLSVLLQNHAYDHYFSIYVQEIVILYSDLRLLCDDGGA